MRSYPLISLAFSLVVFSTCIYASARKWLHLIIPHLPPSTEFPGDLACSLY